MNVDRIVMLAFVVAFTLTAALCDLRTKRLPNVLTVSALVGALLFALVSGLILGGFPEAGRRLVLSLGGFGIGFGVLFILWVVGGGGGGDVKFMGALGAWLGPLMTLQVLLVSTLFVAVGAVAILGWEFCRLGVSGAQRRYLSPKSADDGRRETERGESRAQRRRLMPYGVPVALATWAVLAYPIVIQK